MNKNPFPKFEAFVKRDNDSGYDYTTYQTKYIVAGDTDSNYLLINSIVPKCKTADEIVEFADRISKQCNSLFPDFMKEIFNVTEENSNIIQTDREVVSNKSFFLSKKRYMMETFDDEGSRIPDIKIKGLEIRKSDTPKIVQDFLKNLCMHMLNGRPYNVIKEYVNQFKKEYKEHDIVTVGRPMRLNVFRYYEEMYKKTGSMKNFPYQVRASLFYNSLCGSNHATIKSGDHVRLCYIKHPDSKYIAIPIDKLPHVPNEIWDLHVDWDRQWQTVQKKIESYLEPLGYDEKGQKEAQLKDLFGVEKL